MIAIVEIPERLRREYFSKKENAPLHRGYQHKGGFSLYGHRLSSLYRKPNLRVTWLIKSVQTGFSFSKILNSNAYQKELS